MDEVSVVNNVGEKDCDGEEEEFKTELAEKFTKLLDELEDCDGNEQKQIIDEMNGLMDKMDEEELRSVFTIENFDKIDEMIEESKLTFKNAILLMKRIGYWNELKDILRYPFENSLLSKRFENMILEEDEKKEEKDEKLLIDLCECYIFISYFISWKLLSICIHNFLKAASNKEENEEAKEEVEMALFVLRSVNVSYIKNESYLNEIKEIIKYHQEHRNLTQLAYQSVWKFLIHGLFLKRSLEEVIVNELHFSREAKSEMEALIKCIDWRKKEEEMSREEAKEANIVKGWTRTLTFFFNLCQLFNEEIFDLIETIVRVIRIAKDNFGDVISWCICSLKYAAGRKHVIIEDLLKSGAVDIFLEEIQQIAIEDSNACYCLEFFVALSRRLKRNTNDEIDEAKRKELKRKMFEKMEEEGYEDYILKFQLSNVNEMLGDDNLVTTYEDFFVRA
ncbi:uncharacterized protein MONOS_13059 [Monocercomonoides exilis]|uniref:uncharacterized protein n=1 Tax=Monocercomonoides exilis TaxID=2049356 RepID=UPI00355ACC77|nr:hypothetical protein MONOS_13059 [Monocercomonoides exilis]|eukprot:MONOS_13059.1-p1 / transcript=MONOS_13059.1 / gene=MONOS_13059 / organism=Monocercomonoides_exilis_PA203 / gene_product=unspecified product / transcript_product=unspecified product / location=Mono_scaffold00772:25836-27302(-) / protein_length=449 / sequence_SO=supercontig / SO=protein_coding / is_pseudo=false